VLAGGRVSLYKTETGEFDRSAVIGDGDLRRLKVEDGAVLFVVDEEIEGETSSAVTEMGGAGAAAEATSWPCRPQAVKMSASKKTETRDEWWRRIGCPELLMETISYTLPAIRWHVRAK
jgi:hypothetical protein